VGDKFRQIALRCNYSIRVENKLVSELRYLCAMAGAALLGLKCRSYKLFEMANFCNFCVMILLLQSCRTRSLELHIRGIVIDRNPTGIRFILIFGPRNLDLVSPKN
ncbi:hypothetical protein WUBG_06698, partial [Wuchereria bancrofti]